MQKMLIRNYINCYLVAEQADEWLPTHFKAPSFKHVLMQLRKDYRKRLSQLKQYEREANIVSADPDEDTPERLKFSKARIAFREKNEKISSAFMNYLIDESYIEPGGFNEDKYDNIVEAIIDADPHINDDVIDDVKQAYDNLPDTLMMTFLRDTVGHYGQNASNIPRAGQSVILIYESDGEDLYKKLQLVTGLKKPEIGKQYTGKFKFKSSTLNDDKLSVTDREFVDLISFRRDQALLMKYIIRKDDEITVQNMRRFSISTNRDWMEVSSIYMKDGSPQERKSIFGNEKPPTDYESAKKQYYEYLGSKLYSSIC